MRIPVSALVVVGAVSCTALIAGVHAEPRPHSWPVQLLPGPGPQLPSDKNCAADEKKLLEAQIEAWRQLQGLSRGGGEKICGLIEKAEGLDSIDGKALEQRLSEKTRAILKSLGVDLSKMDLKAFLKELGYDVQDLRAAQAQCRQVQGDTDRMATTEIGRLKQQLAMCEGGI